MAVTDLPPHAQARLERFASSRARASLLSVPSAAGLDAAGFDPVGDVLGACVRQLNRYATAPLGGPGFGVRGEVWLSDRTWNPYRVWVTSVITGYRTVLTRMTNEAVRLGADGIVDVQLHHTPFDIGLWQFTGTGTAVRSRGSARPKRPFTTSLAGTDVAALLLGGWVPVELHVAVEVGLRWVDYQLNQQLRSGMFGGSNVEVDAYTDLITAARDSVRTSLGSAIAGSGADGGLLDRFETRMWSEEMAAVAEVVGSGTAIARFGEARGARPLVILPLGGRKR